MDVSSIKPQVNATVVRDGCASSVAESRQAAGLSTVAAAQAVTQAATPAQSVSRGQVEDAVATIQEFVQSVRRSINFAVEDGSGRVVVKVTDASSGDVIRQIPSEEALKLAENLSEVRSLLFRAEA
jgi:flagellar protein FlaG